MKSEKKPFSFTLFLTGGATARIFYSNGFWEPNEGSNAERRGKDSLQNGSFSVRITPTTPQRRGDETILHFWLKQTKGTGPLLTLSPLCKL
jgi:hypothetical protein